MNSKANPSVQSLLAQLAEPARPAAANPFRLTIDMDGGSVRFRLEAGGRVRINNLLTPGANLPPYQAGGLNLRLDIWAAVKQAKVTWLSIDLIDTEAAGRPVPDHVTRGVLDQVLKEIGARKRLFVEAELVDIHKQLHGIDTEIGQVQSEIDRRKAKLRRLKRQRSNEGERLGERSSRLREMLLAMPRETDATEQQEVEPEAPSPAM